MVRSAPTINLIRFRDFRRRAIGCDSRGSFSKRVLVHPPFVLEVMFCWYFPAGYVAGTVQQRVLVSTMRTRDGNRRNKPRKAWCRRSRGTKGLINASRVFVVATLNILHDHLYCHFVASFRLLQSPCHVLQCSTHYLRAAKDTETSNNLRFSTLPFF